MTAHPPPRIIKIRYRSGVNGRVAIAYARVPYTSLFDLSEKMARLLHTGQVRWFRIEAASAEEISRERDTLTRWHDALVKTIAITRVNLEV